MIKLRRYISDKYHRALIRIELFFVKDEAYGKSLLIAYALYSVEGRKMLGDAMMGGI